MEEIRRWIVSRLRRRIAIELQFNQDALDLGCETFARDVA